MKRLRPGAPALLLAGALAFPLVAGNDYHLTVMSTAFVFALATAGLNLIAGYTGQFNLAHSGFMAVGAYVVGILCVDHGFTFWSALALSGPACALLGLLVGALSLRLRGHYFSIFTLCVGFIMFLVIEKWESLTHGPAGIVGIPAPEALGPLRFDTPLALYYLALALLGAGLFVMHRVVDSLVGRGFTAVRNDEALAQALGVPPMRTKLLAFVLSVTYAGFAGGLYAGFVRFIGPGIAGVEHTFDMSMYMVVGGLGSLLGPIVAAVAVPWAAQYLQFLQEYRFLVFGPVLILFVIYMPQGIAGAVASWRARGGRHA
jgi:branched-chain amino acid transport system permease protein